MIGRLTAIFLILSASGAVAFTAAERAACTPDFIKFCSNLIGLTGVDPTAARICMTRYRKQLSKPCAVVVNRYLKPVVKKKPPQPAVPTPPVKPKDKPIVPVVIPSPPVMGPVVPIIVSPLPPPAPVPVETKKGQHMATVTTLWRLFVENLALCLIVGFIAYYVARNGSASVWAWFKRMWSYLVGAAHVIEDDIAKIVPALSTTVTHLSTRVSTVEADVAAIKQHITSH